MGTLKSPGSFSVPGNLLEVTGRCLLDKNLQPWWSPGARASSSLSSAKAAACPMATKPGGCCCCCLRTPREADVQGYFIAVFH